MMKRFAIYDDYLECMQEFDEMDEIDTERYSFSGETICLHLYERGEPTGIIFNSTI